MTAAGASARVPRWVAVLASERGTVTAEFAVVMPAVLIVLGVVIGGIFLAAHRVTLVSVSAEVARLEARDDRAAAELLLARLGPAVEVERERQGPLRCLTLTSHPAQGLLAGIALSARSCAVLSAGER
jgi:hypothetical protein